MMKQNYLLCLVAIVLIGCVSAPINKKDDREYLSIEIEYLSGPLMGRNITYSHIDFESHVKEGYILTPGEKIGKAQPWPERLSDKHDLELKEAINECDRGNYQIAFNILEGLYESEQDNLFYLITFARTLYWSEQYHQDSYKIYGNIRERLERESALDENEILIDLWFPDLYWKLATFYLDMEDYEKASFEIARTLACGYDVKSRQFEQAISYLTECYFFLKNKEFNNYLYNLARKLFPKNSYVDSFLLK